MKILLLGVFARGSTDVWKARALRALGHRVFPFPYRERPWEELGPLGEPWDLVLVSKGVPLGDGAWQRLVEIGRRVLLFWPDPYQQWTSDLTGALRSQPTVLLAGTSSAVLARIADDVGSGVRERSRRILEGADCHGPMPELWTGPVEPALLHFGHLSERRVEVIERLRAAGVIVNHLEQPLYGAELQREVLRHAAVLGINSSPDLYSNRVQTVLAMGGVMLQEGAPDLLDVHVPANGDTHDAPLVVWAGEDSLIHHARWVTAEVRLHCSICAEATFAEHSWERWAERVLAFACVA